MNGLRLAMASLALFATGCAATDESPPPPKQPEPSTPTICLEMPQPPPQLLSSNDSAAACVPPSFRDGLPIEVSVVKGRIVKFRFYSQCEGKTYSVDPAVERCIRSSLESWRYLVFEPMCPGNAGADEDVPTEQLYLLPSVRKGGVLTRAASVERGCTAG